MSDVLAELCGVAGQLISRAVLVGECVISAGLAETSFNGCFSASRSLGRLSRAGGSGTLTCSVLRDGPGQPQQQNRDEQQYVSHVQPPF